MLSQETEPVIPADAPPVELGPVTETERIDSLDVVRGFAVLGILVMNIQAFSMIGPAYDNPMAYGDIGAVEYAVWLVAHVLFSQKFMTIFTILFGAGIALMCERGEDAGRPVAAVHYRRMVVLIVFGLLHGYLLWHGDILFTYAVCGLWVYFGRHWRPSILISVGVVLMAIPLLVFCGMVYTIPYWPAGDLKEFVDTWTPVQAKIDSETAAFLSSWLGQMGTRAQVAFFVQGPGFVLYTSWLCTGLMLIGMALFKLKVLSAARSAGLYFVFIALAVIIGIPTILFGVQCQNEAQWHPIYRMFLGSQYNHMASILVSLGWIGVIMLICRRRRWHLMTRPLAAVGRMALTNYLMQSVICTLIFYGHGLGYFGAVSRAGQLGVVLGVWLLQLVWSPIWLARFRFGPMEWLWRSLTYWKRQPMLRIEV